MKAVYIIVYHHRQPNSLHAMHTHSDLLLLFVNNNNNRVGDLKLSVSSLRPHQRTQVVFCLCCCLSSSCPAQAASGRPIDDDEKSVAP